MEANRRLKPAPRVVFLALVVLLVVVAVAGLSAFSRSPPSGATSTPSPLKVQSIRLVNRSIGSEVQFIMSFTNIGSSPIYYYHTASLQLSVPCARGDMTTAVVGSAGATTIRDSTDVNSTTRISGCSNSPVAYGSNPRGPTDLCMRTEELLTLQPGAYAQKYSDHCIDGVSARIMSSGTFEADFTLTWFSTPDQHITRVTSVSELFSVG